MRRYLGLFTILLWAPAARAADLPRYQYSIETVAGSSLNGDGGPATAAQIGAIQGIALDGAGNLYLSDTDHNSVRKVDSKGIITTVAGTGTAGFGGDGAAATSALLNLPYGLAADSSGALYVADLGNNRVRRIGPDGVISTVAGTGTAGSAGDGGPATNAQLMAPRNLVVDASGNLYISEFEGHRVRKVSNGQIVTVAGTGVAGFRGDGGTAVAAQLDFPAGLALDQTGDLYIADSENQRIRKVLPNGIISTALGGSPSIALYTPLGVAVDASGDILVGDASYTVRAYTPAGKWSIVAGTGAPGYAGDGGPAVGALLTSVRDLAAAAGGRLYIADGVRVRCVDDSGTISTLAGDGYLHAVGDGGSALAALLSQPSAVALDFAGDLYIADPGTQRVRKVYPDNVIQTLAGTGVAGFGGELIAGSASALNSPMGVAMAPSGIVYIADTYNHRIRAVSADGTIATVAGTGVSGTGAENQPWTATALRGPRGVCVDHQGALYIVDTSNHRVLRASPGALMATAAGNGSPGDAGDGGSARLAQLNQPGACAVDTAGNLYIADTLNHSIRVVTSGGIISTLAGTGQPGASGDEGPATAACLNAPSGVTADDNGNVFIADTGNHVIRQVTADAVIHRIAGQYTAGFAGDGAAATSAQLDAPAGLVLDGAGDLYLADSGNNRVRRLVPGAPVPVAPVIQLQVVSVVSAASLLAGPLAPGAVVTILGSGLGPDSGVNSAFDASGRLPTSLAGVEVLFDGAAAPLFYVQAGQATAQAPYTLAGETTTNVQVSYQNVVVGSADVAVTAAAPAIFPAVVNQDGSLNLDTAPAPRGSIITFYATGDGLTFPASVEGIPASAPYPYPLLPVSIAVAGSAAELLFAASAPGLVGILQVNARIPPSLTATGQQTLTLQVGDAVSPDIPIWLQ